MRQTNILVVEDETLIAWDIKSILEQLNYQVAGITGYANEAVRMTEELRPDLVLMDILLNGEKTGIEAAAEIQERFDIPIIYLTSHGDDAMFEKVKSTTPYGYILKPFNERKLKFTIEIAINKHQAEQTLLQQTREISRLNEELKISLKREEEMLQEKERLLINQAKMATMGEILGIIAHQWRQPLNAVSLLNQEIYGLCIQKGIDSETIEKTIGRSLEQIQFLSDTIDDFRNFLKPPDRTKNFEIGEALLRANSLLTPLLRFNDIALTVLQRLTNKLLIAGYSNEFQQVLFNLASNSCDAIQERKNADPEFQGKIEITLIQKDEEVVLTMFDNGQSPSPETIDSLFKPYFTTKGTEHGTGIGLYISKTIIEKKMGGTIEYKTQQGRSSFILTLPIQKVLS